jgi:hypothetical protein
MTAGRLLGTGGRAILVTDAASHPTGPTRESVDELYASKGARLSVLLSGDCPPPPPRPHARAQARAAPSFAGDGASPEEGRPPDALGNETSVRTFSEESLFSGGLFSFQPGVKTGQADPVTRYSDTLANLGIASVLPAVAAVNPSAVPQGTTLDVELTGSNTSFRPGSTIAVAGAGMTVDSVDVLSPTRLTVRLTASPGATLGFRDVTVSTDRGDGTIESAHGIGAVQVTGPPSGPTVLSVTPSTVAAGSTRDVTISGGLTHFAAGSAAGLGAGVTVHSLSVKSPTEAVANVTADPQAAIAFRSVTVQTGGETANDAVPAPGGSLLVVAAAPAVPRLTAASPASGHRGTPVDVTLTGADTTFADRVSLASIGGTGVDVLSSAVHSPASLTARLRIARDAPLGFRDLRVTTGAENAILLNGFAVTPALPVVSTPTPAPVTTPPPGGPGAVCADTSRPRASLLKGRKGASAKQRKLSLHGRAADAGCGGRLARVEVALSRKAGRKCRFVAANGKLTKARKCTKPQFLRAKGTTRWSLTLKRKLPKGRYAILVRARDAAGNRQATPAKRTLRIGSGASR